MKFNYFDIHAHVNFKAFDEDRDEVIKRAQEKGIGIINVGTQIDTSKKAVEMAHQYEGVYAIIGLHPIHTGASYHDTKELGEEGQAFTSRGELFDKDAYRAFLQDPKVVGLGECGLDYYKREQGNMEVGEQEKQKQTFKDHIELAIEFNKPLMIHCRASKNSMDAYEDILEILNSYFVIHNSKVRGNVHFFAGNLDIAKRFVALGFTLSFTGVITFTRDYDEVIKNTPIEMIMSETDSPYITPVPYRGKRNEPAYVEEVVKKIAEIKGLDLSFVQQKLLENVKRVFDIS